MDEAMKLLREGRATTSNFEMKEEAFNEDGTIKEKSIMTIENIRLGDEVREDVEVMVVSGLKTPIVLGDNYITHEFGSFDIDKENKKLIINKN